MSTKNSTAAIRAQRNTPEEEWRLFAESLKWKAQDRRQKAPIHMLYAVGFGLLIPNLVDLGETIVTFSQMF